MPGEKYTNVIYSISKFNKLWKSENDCNIITTKAGKIQEWRWLQFNIYQFGYTFQSKIDSILRSRACFWSIFQKKPFQANENKEDLCKMKVSNTHIDICKMFWTNKDIVRNITRSLQTTWPSLECLFCRLTADSLDESRKSPHISYIRSTLSSGEESSSKILLWHKNDDARGVQSRFERILCMCFYPQIAIERNDKTFLCFEDSSFRCLAVATEGLNQNLKFLFSLANEAKQEILSPITAPCLHNHISANILIKVSRKVVIYVSLKNVECFDKRWSVMEYPFFWFLLAAAEYLNEFHQMKKLSSLAFDTKRNLTVMKGLRLNTNTEVNTFTETIFVTEFFALIRFESHIFCQLSSIQRIFKNHIRNQLTKICRKQNALFNHTCKEGNQRVTRKMKKCKKVPYLRASTVYKKDETYKNFLKTMTSTFFLGMTDCKHDKYKNISNEWHTLEIISEALIYPVYRNKLEFSFEQILNGIPYFSSEVMRFEHHRLGTFANYSIKNTPSALLMAKSGWYATGNANETKTFCCLQTNSVWNNQDDPYFVHKELSPNCAFINGHDLGQVSIQNGTLEGNRSEGSGSPISEISNNLENTHIGSCMPDLKSTLKTSNDDCYGLMGAEGENQPQTLSNTRNTLESWSIDCPSRLSPARTHLPHIRDTEDSDHGFRDDKFTGITNQDESDQTKKSRMITKYRTGSSEKVHQEFILPPLVLEDPKHVEYSTVGIRASSFGGFPIGSGKTPKEFAVGGFYYKGFGDRTSCFHCGITLQGWSKDDDVLVEHIRYNPLCAYMRRLKGDNFIKLVMSATQIPQCTPSQAETREVRSRSTFNVTSEDVISKLKEMGFSQNTISSALGKDTINNGRVTIQKVLDAITEDTSGEERNLGESTTTQNGSAGNFIDTQDIELGAYLNSTNQSGSVASGLSHEISRKSDQSSLEFKEQCICKICMDERVGVVFTPCGHIVTCSECARSVRKCPICRETIRDKIRTIIND